VRVARMTAATPHSLAIPLLGDTDQLLARVDRLLHPAPLSPQPNLPLSAILLAAGSLAVAILQPAALHSVHQALERIL